MPTAVSFPPKKNRSQKTKSVLFLFLKQKKDTMKKVIAFLAVVVCFSVATAKAQGGGGAPQMTPEQRAAQTKERLAPLNLTATQADTAVAVFLDVTFQRAIYGTANFRDMTPEDRAAKQKELAEARQKRLEKSMPADVAKKIVETLSTRQGGGRPGGGGGK
jgi:hypothetical protein